MRLAASMAGRMMRVSSSPNMPFSPACGLRPHTAIRGFSIPSCRQNWWPRSIGSYTLPMVRTFRTSMSGRCAVASATRRRGELNIMLCRLALVRNASSSVCPGHLKPPSDQLSLLMGPVTMASTRRGSLRARIASVMASSTNALERSPPKRVGPGRVTSSSPSDV